MLFEWYRRLVFSQSLLSLDIIEKFLGRVDEVHQAETAEKDAAKDAKEEEEHKKKKDKKKEDKKDDKKDTKETDDKKDEKDDKDKKDGDEKKDEEVCDICTWRQNVDLRFISRRSILEVIFFRCFGI